MVWMKGRGRQLSVVLLLFAILFLNWSRLPRLVNASISVGFDHGPLAAPPDPPPENDFILSMPLERIKYTIVVRDGTLWAQVEAEFPIFLSWPNIAEMSMLYPTPPNTTDIHLWLDGDALNWFSYSDINPHAKHNTDLGDWEMIYFVIDPVPQNFTLAIQYEHPIENINGNYTFLYDLNIGPYLSSANPNSTAHFNVSLEVKCANVAVYTTGSSGVWNPVNFTTIENGDYQLFTFDIVSEYEKPLPGDIVVSMQVADIPEFQWLPVLFVFIFLFSLLSMRRFWRSS